jgi:phosphoheptose isomerase
MNAQAIPSPKASVNRKSEREQLASKDRLHERMTSVLKKSAELKLRVAETCGRQILQASGAITKSFAGGGKLLLCGNGGSAADCQHMAAEFVSRLTAYERRALPALSLTTDTSMLTAYANDLGFDGVFERQVEAHGKPGDVLLGISTSGNSANVVRAVERANEIGMTTIGLMGNDGHLRALCDISINVPDDTTQLIQEAHLSIEHLICDLVEIELFDRP